MAKPLIIFGAGASHDYSSLGGAIVAPLTNDLVADNFLQTDLLEKYRGAGDLLSDVVHQVRTKGKSFESVLTGMKARTAHAPQMRRQFAALEFYLKALFKRISTPADLTRQKYQINNYRIINNRIHTYAEGKACVVTFNYDTLFEYNLGASAPQKMSEYISGDIKIFKLHGSHDWVYVQPRSLMQGASQNTENQDYHWYLEHPEFSERVLSNSNAAPYHEHELQEISDRNDYAWFPALAVPLAGKGRYVCPPDHIEMLGRMMLEIDRVLIIGWKAGDPLLLDTLMKCLTPGYKVLIVSLTVDEARQIANTIREKLHIHEDQVFARGGGFSDFAADEISHSFFSI